VTNSNIYSNF